MSSKKNTFSIIVPVYNCETYLSRCLDSVLNQSYKKIELILIDDGSTDSSGQICDFYKEKDKRVVVIHKKNNGVSSARNDGLKFAKSKYICFLDSDDYISGEQFDEINNILKQHKNVELINFGFYSDVDDSDLNNLNSDIIKYKDILYNSHEEIKNDFVNLWDSSMLYNIWNKVYLKKIIDDNKIKFPKHNFGEDVEFNRLYLDKINSMYNSSRCFYHYIREREGAATKKYSQDIFNIRKNEFKEFNDYFDKWQIDKLEYYEYSCRRYIERVLGCIETVCGSNLKFSNRYNEIKRMINDDITRESLKYAELKSKKVRLMIIPVKYKMVYITMLMGKVLNIVKTKFPALFNKLKNRR